MDQPSSRPWEPRAGTAPDQEAPEKDLQSPGAHLERNSELQALEALAADPEAALESSPDGHERAQKTGSRAGAWLSGRTVTLREFLTYARVRDLWAGLYSILLILAASLVFGRLPKLPVPVLVFIPFVYLSLLGGLLLMLGLARDRYIGKPANRLLDKLLGPSSVLAGFLKRDGTRMLRTAFGVGVYLFAGLLYLAVGPADDVRGWLLMPCLLLGMVAIFSLNQQIVAERREGGLKKLFRRAMLKRGLVALLLMASLYTMYHYLIQPLKNGGL